MKECNILIPVGGRSNEALVQPIIKRLLEQEWCNIVVIEIEAGNFIESYKKVRENILKGSFDLVYIVGDRLEMFGASLAAYHNNVPIAHYGGGIIEGFSTFDEIHRHSISMMADIELCESEHAAGNVSQLWYLMNKFDPIECSLARNNIEQYEHFNIHIVGNLYLEGLEDVDESLVPNKKYDLILCNPITHNIMENVKGFGPLIYDNEKIGVIIGPNPDEGFLEICYSGNNIIKYDNLPRPQFLGLLKNCQRYITNSSSAYYEAPYFLKPDQIIMIGERNKNRSTPKVWDQDYKTSDKICEILKQWW